MKKLYKNSLVVIGSLAVVLLLSNCGGDSNNWGIDHSDLPQYNSDLPQCNEDIQDTSSAVKVVAGSIVTPLTDDTTLRVWHYENNDKLVCVITGEASISKEEG